MLVITDINESNREAVNNKIEWLGGPKGYVIASDADWYAYLIYDLDSWDMSCLLPESINPPITADEWITKWPVPLEIRPGKYKTRSGDVVEILMKHPKESCFIGLDPYNSVDTWLPNGNYLFDAEHNFDLVERIEDLD